MELGRWSLIIQDNCLSLTNGFLNNNNNKKAEAKPFYARSPWGEKVTSSGWKPDLRSAAAAAAAAAATTFIWQ
jgi:hypothetical protein